MGREHEPLSGASRPVGSEASDGRRLGHFTPVAQRFVRPDLRSGLMDACHCALRLGTMERSVAAATGSSIAFSRRQSARTLVKLTLFRHAAAPRCCGADALLLGATMEAD